MQTDHYKHSFKVLERPPASLAVYNTGLQRCDPGFCWGPGVRDHFLIHFVTDGHGTYAVGGRTFALSRGDMFLIRPEEAIRYAADADDPWSYCWVGFGGLDAPMLVTQTDFGVGRYVLHFDGTEPGALLAAIYRTHGSLPHEAARMTGNLYAFLAWLIERASFAKPARMAAHWHVQRACAFIANNFAEAITIEDVAAHVGLSRSQLFRVFEQQLDCSPVRYLAQFRMRQACLLLRRTNLPIKAVALSVGYGDPLYFSRRFREIVGVSPTEYAGE